MMNNTNDFTKRNVTDVLYKKIIRELRTNANGDEKKKRGRKRELTPEILYGYLFNLSMTGEYEIAAESAGLPEKRRQKYMTESETFRGVSELAKKNISLRAKMTVAESIMGRKPSYFQLIHPATNQPTYIEMKEILPELRAAMWWLERSTRSVEKNRQKKIHLRILDLVLQEMNTKPNYSKSF